MAFDRGRDAARQGDPGPGGGAQAAGGPGAGFGRAAGTGADRERWRVGGDPAAGRHRGRGSPGADSGRGRGDARRGAAPGSRRPGPAGAGGCDRRPGGSERGAGVRAGAPAHAGRRRGLRPRAGPPGGRGAGPADGGLREAADGVARRGDGLRAGQRARPRGPQRAAPADDQPVQLPEAAQRGLRRPGSLQHAAALRPGRAARAGGGGAPHPGPRDVFAGTAAADGAVRAPDSGAGVPQLHAQCLAGIQRPPGRGGSGPGAGRRGL